MRTISWTWRWIPRTMSISSSTITDRARSSTPPRARASASSRQAGRISGPDIVDGYANQRTGHGRAELRTRQGRFMTPSSSLLEVLPFGPVIGDANTRPAHDPDRHLVAPRHAVVAIVDASELDLFEQRLEMRGVVAEYDRDLDRIGRRSPQEPVVVRAIDGSQIAFAPQPFECTCLPVARGEIHHALAFGRGETVAGCGDIGHELLPAEPVGEPLRHRRALARTALDLW